MSVLQDFLAENADLINEEQEVVVSKRFKDKDGNSMWLGINSGASISRTTLAKDAYQSQHRSHHIV